MSDSSALTGATDGVYVLTQKGRNSNDADLICAGRRIRKREMQLRFENGHWDLLADSLGAPDHSLPEELQKLVAFVCAVGMYSGGNAEFAERYNSAGADTDAKHLKQLMQQRAYDLEQHGVKYLNFQNSSGLISKPVAESYEEAQKQFILGLNNGIIVGFQTLNTDSPNGGFMAYDQQCPNCVRNENNTVNPNYRIQMSDNGIATCGKCGKKYDLNNGGIILNGNKDDTGLEKYVANTLGPFSWVSVRRR